MTKQELLEAIKNGESVWVALDDKVERLVRLKWFTDDIVIDRDLSHIITKDDFNRLYKTKAEAEHYLNHANVSRTEQLPFLTWEEFLEKKDIRFYTKDGDEVVLYITDDGNNIYVIELKPYGYWGKWNATEANFYKAYDECVRLFKGE